MTDYYNYHNDLRCNGSNAYGTYPGKNHIIQRNNSINNGEFPLLHQSSRLKMNWQSAMNPAFLPLSTSRRTSPTRRGESPQFRQMRAPSPQKGILKSRASPVNLNSRSSNFFDCPASSSTLMFNEIGTSTDGMYGSKDILSRGNGTSNGFFINEISKSSLQKSMIADSARGSDSPVHIVKIQKRHKLRLCIEVLQTLAIEFFALTFSILLHYHIQFVLSEQWLLPSFVSTTTSSQNTNSNVMFGLFKIVVFALTDATLTLALFAVFPTIHLNPVITIAYFFSTTIPYYICFGIAIVQVCACLFSAFLLFVYLSFDNHFTADLPSLTSIGLNNSGSNVREAYQMVFNQFLGTALVVICHIRYSKDYWSQKNKVNDLSRFVSIFGAVWLSSFLSLTRSNVSWNPITGLTILVKRFFLDVINGIGFWDSLVIWRNHYVFWMGPILGALFGCILCRISFTKSYGRKIFKLDSTSKSSDLLMRQSQTM